jgi:beta-mannosidase
MEKLQLNGKWNLSHAENKDAISANVPGCVHLDLLANDRIENPFYRDNERKQLWIGETDWTYHRSFEINQEFFSHERIHLRCLGLDTLATIWLNDRELAQTNNMYRTWEFEVKSYLKIGQNTIKIHFASPVSYVKEQEAKKGVLPAWSIGSERLNSGAYLRKEPCNFGWDWGPMLVTSGIWRDIDLLAFNTTQLAEIQIVQEHGVDDDGQDIVDLTVNLRLNPKPKATVTAVVSIAEGDGTIFASERVTFNDEKTSLQIRIRNPLLWWPNGMGEQPLYDVLVGLFDKDLKQLDYDVKRIGLRTLRLERHQDEWGESFQFSCNAVPFFAKGANVIPANVYPSAATDSDYERLIQSVAEANMNMLRVWGGGIYEEDIFYNLCDQYGITVWQDFMFACGIYPANDEAFLANVKAEAQDNIRRIRHHPCLALWCGNNEIEQGMGSDTWQQAQSWQDYSKLFDDLLAKLVKELDPQRDYWPGSPHSPCGDRNNWMNPNCGDVHLWGVWHGKKPFEWYRENLHRFVSEFGFQSFPPLATIREVTIAEDHALNSPIMQHFQRSHIGNGVIGHFIEDWFGKANSFESTVYLSQFVQGIAMKYAVEHWRRNMPQTMGTLYWQLNDLWPAPSWSSLDWKGNWKALHYMAKRFFEPILVSGIENIEANTVDIHVSNDDSYDHEARVVWMITDAGGNVLAADDIKGLIAARHNTHLKHLNLQEYVEQIGQENILIWLTLYIGKKIISENLLLLTRPRYLPLVEPLIAVHIDPRSEQEFVITLSAERPSLYTWMELDGAHFSDNFIHLPARRAYEFKLKSAEPMTVEAVREQLKVRSLLDLI